MWNDAIIVALITQTFGLIGLLINQFSSNKKQKQMAETQQVIAEHAKEARDQTANSHKTNFRDDLDSVALGVVNLTHAVEGIKQDQSQLVVDVDRLGKMIEAQHKDDEFLEHTIDRLRVNSERALARAVEDRKSEFIELHENLPHLIQQVIVKGGS